MLLSLHVKNLALIQEAEVFFSKGLNILTGETGAGKSIIIGSMNLALGEKVPKELLRDNEEDALVELIFQVENQWQRQTLAAMDIYPENDEVSMTRRIMKGRSIGKINGESTTTQKMREVASLFIDIYGQKEHQSLLNRKKHLELLDDYGKNQLKDLKDKLRETYKEYKKLAKENDSVVIDEQERIRELSFLEFEVAEIEEAAILEDEDEELERSYKRMINSKKILTGAGEAYRCTDDGEENAADFIGRAYRELSAVTAYDHTLDGICSQLSDIDGLLNDFNRELAEYLSKSEFEEEDFSKVENRLNSLNHLKAKYGGSLPMVMEALNRKSERIAQLQKYDLYLEALKKQFAEVTGQMNEICEEISKVRKKCAKKLAKEVEKSLSDLNFLDVRFDMEFSKLDHFTANGYDDPQFVISTNPGEPLKPIDKVASGGELSRIMLGLKSVLASNEEIGTLIFDEIDSGISGRTAQKVSEKMNAIGRHHQVICITHLPQIASMADAHYLIEKSVIDSATISTICRLGEEESVVELARMLGGVQVTQTVMESAKEMRQLAILSKKIKV
ncbi:MAG: DNA repair protein RecN [Lachnospiraceae bacterium]